MRLRAASVGLLLCGMCALAAPAVGDTPPTINIELNQLVEGQGKCTMALLFHNTGTVAITQMTLELVTFGSDGGMDNLVRVSSGALPGGKTVLRQYDLDGKKCDRVGRLLLNGITACEGDELSPDKCLAMTGVKSRLKVPFGL